MGDWVRITVRPLVGHVFQVDDFSTMDGLEDHPRIPNPRVHQDPFEPLFLRFAPEELEEANALDRIVEVL